MVEDLQKFGALSSLFTLFTATLSMLRVSFPEVYHHLFSVLHVQKEIVSFAPLDHVAPKCP